MLKYLCLVLFSLGSVSLQAAESKSSEAVMTADDQNFDQVVATGVVVVDFYADWCFPCRQFAPTFAAVAEQTQGDVHFVKVNIDHARTVANKFQIKSIPTLLIFKDGKEVHRRVGGTTAQQLQQIIQSVL